MSFTNRVLRLRGGPAAPLQAAHRAIQPDRKRPSGSVRALGYNQELRLRNRVREGSLEVAFTQSGLGEKAAKSVFVASEIGYRLQRYGFCLFSLHGMNYIKGEPFLKDGVIYETASPALGEAFCAGLLDDCWSVIVGGVRCPRKPGLKK